MPEKIKKVKRPWVQERKPFERERRHDDFDYNGRKWRNLRKHQLTLKPLCEKCLEDDVTVLATVADHVIPVKKGGAGYSLENLQSLCKRCHNSKSARDK